MMEHAGSSWGLTCPSLWAAFAYLLIHLPVKWDPGESSSTAMETELSQNPQHSSWKTPITTAKERPWRKQSSLKLKTWAHEIMQELKKCLLHPEKLPNQIASNHISPQHIINPLIHHLKGSLCRNGPQTFDHVGLFAASEPSWASFYSILGHRGFVKSLYQWILGTGSYRTRVGAQTVQRKMSVT